MSVREKLPLAKDLIGKKFAKLLVIKDVRQANKICLLCDCDCGGMIIAVKADLLVGRVKSCGCSRITRISSLNSKYTDEELKLRSTWMGMKDRCYNPKATSYPYYGAKGVKICDRWKNNLSNFVKDMGPKPGPNYSIDRINVMGDYCPENCRWATAKEQRKNQRKK